MIRQLEGVRCKIHNKSRFRSEYMPFVDSIPLIDQTYTPKTENRTTNRIESACWSAHCSNPPCMMQVGYMLATATASSVIHPP